MNSIDKNPNYKELYQQIKTRFDDTLFFNHSAWDETYYSLRVYETAKEILKRLPDKVNSNLILVSAILHDIGKSNLNISKMFNNNERLPDAHLEWDKHPELGVPIAVEILETLGHSSEFIEEICYLVENHDNRKKVEKTFELKILQDADLIADSGYAGFIRPFLYAGKMGRSIIGTINYLKTEVNRVMHEGGLNLEISKKFAEEKIKIEKELILGIATDLDSDLL